MADCVVKVGGVFNPDAVAATILRVPGEAWVVKRSLPHMPIARPLFLADLAQFVVVQQDVCLAVVGKLRPAIKKEYIK